MPRISWKVFFRKVYNKLFDTDVFDRAAQIGFYFSFALFPLLLFLVSLLGLLLDSADSLRKELYQYLAQIMPASAYELVYKTMNEVIESSSGGKITVGVFVTLWSASAGADSIRSGLNAVYQVSEKRPWWYTKLQSLVLTLLFILLVAISLAVVTAGWQLVQFVVASAGLVITSPWVLWLIQWVAIIVVMILATAVIYNWIPSFDEEKWRWASPGAFVAIVLWILLSSGFRLYLQFFNSYNKAYGSLGAVIILMLWMYFTGMAILIGGVINSVLSEMAEE